MRREFKIRNGEGRNLDIVAKFESYAGQAPYFSITSQNGSNHDEMLACAPDEVRDDIAALVGAHLCDGDGQPTHGIANALYRLEQGDVDAAVKSLGHAATRDDIVHLAKKRAELDVTHSEDLRRGLREPLLAAAKEVADAEARIAGEKRDGKTFLSHRKLHAALAGFAAVAAGKEAPSAYVRHAPEAIKAGMKLMDGQVHHDARRVATKGLSEAEETRIAKRADKAIMEMAANDLLDHGGLRERWRSVADRAREALQGPDYMLADRPDPSVDTTTFGGFAAVNGLALEILATKPLENRRVACQCRMTHAGTGVTYDFEYSGPSVPAIEDALESFQTDCASVLWSDVDEFLQDLGYVGDIKQVRQGEKAYEACRNEGRVLLSMLGEDGMASFLSEVGDNPAYLSDGLPPNAFSDAPAPSMR